MARTKVVVDPLTRIEGHLRIEVQAEGGRIADAWAVTTMFRGIETVLKGRDPRDAWAFAQRICGVCTVVHAIASCRAVEDALRITIPPNANHIRNLVQGMQYVHDHVMHFYHLHAFDWVDVVSALKADPAGAARIGRSISPWPNNDEAHLRDVQQRVKAFVDSGQLGIFTNGYWGHPAYRLPPEVNLLAVSHYLEALDWQRHVVKLHTIFGGKNPHPNFLVGGMACAINLDDTGTINAVRLNEIASTIKQAQAFVEQVYWPDLLAIAGFYKDWAAIGAGLGNYLCCGDFPEGGLEDLDRLVFPRGIVAGKNLDRVLEYDHQKVKEFISRSWYEYPQGENAGLHPWEGETIPKYDGPPTPWQYVQDSKRYTWMKAPRYDGMAMEVGPLARALVGYAAGREEMRELVGEVLGRLEVGPAALFSTLGRTAARGVETVLIARRLSRWYDQLVDRIRNGDTRVFNGEHWEPASWPATAQGYGFLEAPRGALGHWVQIADGKISRYQAVVPTTWNASPRDAEGQVGAYEAALVDNHPLLRNDQPLEILRTVHSFDPCMACGVHVLDATGGEVAAARIQ